MKNVKVYLDDIRPGPNGWLVIRNPITFKEIVNKWFMSIDEISMDHDLGFVDDTDKEITGYDLLCWLEDFLYDRDLNYLPKISVHSANPVGAERMQKMIDRLNGDINH